METPFPSRVPLSSDVRAHLALELDRTLASLLDLRSQVKHAHWNVKGPWFVARHQLFDALADHLDEWSDSIAERAATLGAIAHGTTRHAAAATEIPEYDSNAIVAEDHVRVLADRYALVSSLLRQRETDAGENADVATQDLYTEVMRGLELDLWFLESHLVRGAMAR